MHCRCGAIIVLLLVLTTLAPPAQAAPTLREAEGKAANGQVGVGGMLESGGPSTNPSESVPDFNEDASDVDYYYALLDGPDGPCIGWTSDPARALSFSSAGQVFSLFDACPAAEGEEPDPGAVARLAVLQFWAGKPVPPLAPRIQPGSAITGLPAFLEAGPDSATGTTLHVTTPVGTGELVIEAPIVVDWGDGSAAETHQTTGGPWPEGPVRHVYRDAEAVTVRVTQTWTGSWRIVDGIAAGHGGALPPLPMDASFALPVTQVQAVVQ